YMAIILDGRVQGQPPVIRGQIGANGQIELGNKSLQEASDLALVLRAGALPAPLSIVEERTIGPSLGADSVQDGVPAGVVGLLLGVDDGFLHAMNAIVDSNVSTVLTALILYAVGTGPVQGFAITLIIGIAASMVSAIFVVKTLFLMWLNRRPDMVTLSI